MKTEHKYAQALRWIADGEKVQARYKDKRFGSFPSDFDSAYVGRMLEGDDGWEFSLKPRTITVNGREVPEPVREPLSIGSKYFVPCVDTEELYLSGSWSGYDVSFRRLKYGLVHLTKEAAIAHAKAMLNID